MFIFETLIQRDSAFLKQELLLYLDILGKIPSGRENGLKDS